MATLAKRTSDTSLQLIKPLCLVATMYTGAEGEQADQPQGDTIIFDEVVRDTTQITQDDNNTTTIENEFSDDPIMDIVSLGAFQFQAEVADVQREVLTGFGGYTYDAANKRIYAPGTYKKYYAKIDLVYEDGTDDQGNAKYKSICIPKLQLASRMLVESTNTNLLRLQLAGTAKSIKITVNSGTADQPVNKVIKSAIYVNESFIMPTETT